MTQAETVSVTVADEYIVGDNYSVYLDGSTIGTTPPEPLYGPAYSEGTFTASVQPGTHLITIQDVGGIAYYDQGYTFMIPAGYLVTISLVSAPKPVEFVHGWSASYRSSDWTRFVDYLTAQLGETTNLFEYYQDKGDFDKTSGTCTSRSVQLPAQPDGGMPVDLTSISGSICDSASDIGLNAVLLDSDVQSLYAQTGQPVVLIANSMGAAIVRGFLAYSSERGDGVASTMVDSVFYLEGAQQGAFAAYGAYLSTGLWPISQILQQGLPLAGYPAGSRPANYELAPMSSWYRWVNPPASHLPQLPSFNAYGDISVDLHPCADIGPFSACLSLPLPTGIIGDLVLLPGSDDPHAVPPTGGARFLDGSPGSQNWEWALEDQLQWNPWADPFAVGLATEAFGSPVFHGNLGKSLGGTLSNTTPIMVPDCQNPTSTPLVSEITHLVGGRVTGNLYSCVP